MACSVAAAPRRANQEGEIGWEKTVGARTPKRGFEIDAE